MRRYLIVIAVVMAFILKVQAGSDNGVHQFEIDSIDGKPTSLSQYKGKVLLMVNTASNCGYTPQYNELEVIYQKYKSYGLVVLGFPSNDFGGQEPGTNEEIKKFCNIKDGKYKISFPMFAKINIKSEPKNPIYSYLTEKTNSAMRGPVKWNFEKFVISKKGELVARFPSKIAPDAPEVISTIEKELGLYNK